LLITLPRGRAIQLCIIPLDAIRPHEKTIHSLLGQIRNDMSRTGYQRDPILVDRRTRLALDGMHRIESLRSLKAKYAVCAEFDYLDESVKLERWLRTIIAPGRKIIAQIISEFNMEPCQSIGSAIRRVETGRSSIALLSSEESYVGSECLQKADLYRKIGEVDALCEKSRTELQFFPESEKLNLFSSASVATIFPERLAKKDILRIVKRGELLPYKTTRHVVPIRPMGVYFPISCLKECSPSQCRKELERIVNFSKVILERRDIWYEGRRYSDRLAIFREGS
jgi:L-serine kinase (ADP)